MKDIIERLKANKRPFGLMDKELQEAAEKIGVEDFEGWCVGPLAGWNKIIARKFYCETVYRLRPDYSPEPEVVRCKIFENGCDVVSLMYSKKGNETNNTYLCKAIEDPDFAGFEFDMIDSETHSEMWLNLDPEHKGNYKWTHASHVRFKK